MLQPIDRKQSLIAAIRKWLRQRPGMEFGNYGDWSAYRAELRGITKDLHQAETMLQAITWRDSITADDIIAASVGAYSGRLTIDPSTLAIDYCVGQYWPTEYRRAVCSVLSSVLWAHWRQEVATADDIRKTAARELGRGIARRWFN